MSSTSRSSSNGRKKLAARPPEDYPTLKKSLSASFRHVSLSTAENDVDIKPEEDAYRPTSSAGSNLPLSVNIPKVAGAADAALAALQYLPMPLLVLSSWKTIILANDAMGRLLGLDAQHDESLLDRSQATSAIGDLLRGQSLSQIGVDMLQEGQRIWVSWEVCSNIFFSILSYGLKYE